MCFQYNLCYLVALEKSEVKNRLKTIGCLEGNVGAIEGFRGGVSKATGCRHVGLHCSRY